MTTASFSKLKNRTRAVQIKWQLTLEAIRRFAVAYPRKQNVPERPTGKERSITPQIRDAAGGGVEAKRAKRERSLWPMLVAVLFSRRR